MWRALHPRSAEELLALYETLSKDEQERTARYLVENARENFILSRGSLRNLLGRYLDAAPESLEFEYTEYGRPLLAGSHRDAGVSFNVSHSGDVIVYAISRDREVGIDVELVRSDFDHGRLAQRYFSEAEGERLMTLTREEERPTAFFHCWTRKEAYLKLKSAGLTFPLNRFQVTLLPGEAPALIHTEIDEDHPEDFVVSDIAVEPGYLCAMIVTKPEPKVRFWDWSQ